MTHKGQPVSATIHHGDCIEVMQTMPENSIDAIVTDPPYGLGFRGRKWDALPPGKEWAEECLRVLKPGGHILAFGGSRTWHRLAVAIEDGGFEMRDSIAWLYGTGLPKHRAALKPAFEPIVMGRKPFKGSLATNEATHGTGALNIDASRIGTTVETWPKSRMYGGKSPVSMTISSVTQAAQPTGPAPSGRWPANVILDESTAAELDQQSGVQRDGVAVNRNRNGSEDAGSYSGGWRKDTKDSGYGSIVGASRFFYVAKAPKKERPNVDGAVHPTVKPLTLMRHLIKLVTPEGGTILDTFAGSGTTLEAATLEGYESIGIENEAEYLPLIQHRLERTKIN